MIIDIRSKQITRYLVMNICKNVINKCGTFLSYAIGLSIRVQQLKLNIALQKSNVTLCSFHFNRSNISYSKLNKKYDWSMQETGVL